MHVVLLSHDYPPFIFGGIGTFARDLAQGLSRMGIKVTVVSGYPSNLSAAHGHDVSQDDRGGITVLRFPYPNIPPRHVMFQVLNYKKLFEAIRGLAPDIIHGQAGSTFPALLSLKRLAPLVVTFHGSPKVQRTASFISLTRGGSVGDFLTYGLGYLAWEFAFKEEFENSTAAVAVSKTFMNRLMHEMGDKCQSKIRCITNGVDLETLDYESPSTLCEEKEKIPVILFGGRLFWSKGALNLLRLARFLHDRINLNLKIIICGSGPLYKNILQEKLRYGLTSVVLKAFVPRTEFLKYMRMATFVAILSYDEACPMLLLESMCMGKIPIMFNLPYAREFTRNGKYGILANNIEDMAMKIESTCNTGNSEAFGNEIRVFSRKTYDVNVTALRYYQLYKELCR